jgi:hypothetical protein
MRQRRTGGLLLLALLGAWLSHTAIYVHLRGAAGLQAELLASPHRYMLPAAGLILVATGLAVRRAWRLWCDLGLRLSVVRTAVDRVQRGLLPASPLSLRGVDGTLRPGRLLALWAALAPLQLTLYVLQENLETRWAHQAAPGLSALWSDHWAATVIHLVTALVLCAVAAWLTRGVAHRARSLVVQERLLRWLLRRLSAARSTARAVLLEPPLDRFGPQLWSRPPPLLARR